jgi:hypothetical protein
LTPPVRGNILLIRSDDGQPLRYPASRYRRNPARSRSTRGVAAMLSTPGLKGVFNIAALESARRRRPRTARRRHERPLL